MEKSKNKVIVILGPTSSGKSDAAIRLAKKLNGEIISADSRQIYCGMDIGTGKIHGTWSMEHKTFISDKIPHHLIDIINPQTDYSVAKFKNNANYVINCVIKKNKLPIICGGTGFWIKAVVDDVDFPEVKPDQKLRNKLAKESLDKLFLMLKKLDQKRAENIDAKNKVRLIRAIEIAKKLGYVPKIDNKKTLNKNYQFLQIGIDVSKEKLHKNIKKRLEKRFKEGMIKEVKKMRTSGLSWKKIQSFGLGYYWIPLFLQNKITRSELFEKVYQAEKDYAKRQMTWFKKDKRIKWLKNYRKIEKEIQKFIKN